MDKQTAQRLIDMTSAFYAQERESFNATRLRPWTGWNFLPTPIEVAQEKSPVNGLPTCHLLDVACGNLRFERHQVARGSERECNIEAWCVDNNDELAAALPLHTLNSHVHYQHLDISQTLLDGDDLGAAIQAPQCDLTVCFGFMHHLPLASQRSDLMRALVTHTRPGGYVAVTFWQFMRDQRLAAKARAVPEAGAGDYLLGWQDSTDVARFCHHFEEEEIDGLVQEVSDLAEEIRRYSADGRSDNLNRYVVLQRV